MEICEAWRKYVRRGGNMWGWWQYVSLESYRWRWMTICEARLQYCKRSAQSIKQTPSLAERDFWTRSWPNSVLQSCHPGIVLPAIAIFPMLIVIASPWFLYLFFHKDLSTQSRHPDVYYYRFSQISFPRNSYCAFQSHYSNRRLSSTPPSR